MNLSFWNLLTTSDKFLFRSNSPRIHATVSFLVTGSEITTQSHKPRKYGDCEVTVPFEDLIALRYNANVWCFKRKCLRDGPEKTICNGELRCCVIVTAKLQGPLDRMPRSHSSSNTIHIFHIYCSTSVMMASQIDLSISAETFKSLQNSDELSDHSSQGEPDATSDSGKSDQHSFRAYTRRELLEISLSPLVEPPPNMPELKSWFG